jgi:hypothetical protein
MAKRRKKTVKARRKAGPARQPAQQGFFENFLALFAPPSNNAAAKSKATTKTRRKRKL